MLYKKSYVSLTIHTKQKWFLKIMKKNKNIINKHYNNESYKIELKKYYSMSER